MGKKNLREERLGEIGYNRFGSKMWVIEYNHAHDIIVKFENGYTRNAEYKDFKNGRIKNPYDKSIHNVGFFGEGKYKSKINGKTTKQYEVWRGMLDRCYDERCHVKFPTYKDCVVCDDWHSFQSFAEWFNKNYYKIEDEIISLDKDILVKGNKIYSPDTSIFVPQRINMLFVSKKSCKRKFPIGVSYSARDKKYQVHCSRIEGAKNLGLFDTTELGFKAYKEFKENYIKQVADEYKNRIPAKLYEALYDYKIEITD